MKWCRRAAKAGSDDAQYRLGQCYLEGDGIQQNWKDAVHWLQKAADQGDAAAMHALGMCYDPYNPERSGKCDGVKADARVAVKWYAMSAGAGSTEGMFRLAASYSEGRGIEQDEKKSNELLKRGAEAGSVDCMALYGIKGIAAVNDGWSPAQVAASGVDDYATGARWLGKVADKGNDEAQFHLGMMLIHGDGVEEDFDKGLAYVQRAAAAGHEEAEAALARALRS